MKYDVVVIGSGPGGCVCAIRCAQLGMKTAIVEKYDVLGGTCTNVGCIPSKTVLDSSEHFYNANTLFEEHGIEMDFVSLNFKKMMERKEDVVDQNNRGVAYLMKKNKIAIHKATASFKDSHTLVLTADDGSITEISTSHTVIATGSKPNTIPGISIDKKRIITSTEALSLKELPKSMIVIGGGIIGAEMGSVFARIGTEVTILEYSDGLIPTMDRELGKNLRRVLRKTGITVHLGYKVETAQMVGDNVNVTGKNKKSQPFDFTADYCLVATGRKPYTKDLGLEKIGVQLDGGGRVITDENLQTNIEGVYAIGDVVKGPMLAHKAMEEGVYLAEKLDGQKPFINYNKIPSVVYTWPEVAGVGSTEELLKEEGVNYRVGKFPFKASSRARVSMDTEGFLKVLADKETDEILGIHVIGARAADIIATAVTAMEYRATAEEQADMSYAHPTFMEALKNACLDVHGRAVDM